MSRWRALAAAHDVADADLRTALVDALETLYVVADALNASHDDVGPVAPTERDLLDGIHELAGLANNDGTPDVEAECEEFERRAERAEERLEPSLQRIGELEEENKRLQASVDALTVEAIARQPMLDAYADLLARARTFVTFAERHGVPAKHCRPVNSNARKRGAK